MILSAYILFGKHLIFRDLYYNLSTFGTFVYSFVPKKKFVVVKKNKVKEEPLLTL